MTPVRRGVCRLARTLVIAALLPGAANAQTAEQRLRQQQNELEAIRKERADLQKRLGELQGKAHDLSEEATNLRRQADATARLVRQLDVQLVEINRDVQASEETLQRAEQEVSRKRGSLKQRLMDIYKRGPMYTTEALLSARSFGELVGRYKYLHELTLNDKAAVKNVERLYEEIDAQRTLLVRLQTEIERNRGEKAQEETRLRSMQGQRQRSLQEVQQTEQQVRERLARIQRDEQRLGQLLASMEDTRRRNEARPNAPAPSASTLKTTDLGRLDWPVDGDILYSFGRVINPNNTAVRWNGVGIGAPSGTAVRSVAAGTVTYVQPIGTYGLTIIVQHGGGDYSVYGSLSRADVRVDQQVTKGQVIGGVGAADPDMPPHLHFEIRPKGRATDPLGWLRRQ
ncbi:MAG: peptidoglycan DD-metalloendopeptidase family protein [Gemmatimonadetes bacterium]|nr:peptidoglycan DD-metalloendopeptidase family protein [Gemmatimonadota bacterium]